MMTQNKSANGLSIENGFYPDPNKEANETNKSDSAKVSHRSIKFDNNSISKSPSQKHLGVVLNSKLNFISHLDEKM